MKNIFILSLFSLLFLAVRCPKNDSDNPSNKTTAPPEVLPPATQTGANTYGCLLNGKVWLPSIGGSGPSGAYGFIAQYYMGDFTLGATKKNDTSLVTIHWQHTNVHHIGIYYFRASTPIGGGNTATFTNYDNPIYSYSSSDNDSLKNNVTVTRLDTLNSIISGTFNFLFTQQGKDTMRITNGRFDVKYTN